MCHIFWQCQFFPMITSTLLILRKYPLFSAILTPFGWHLRKKWPKLITIQYLLAIPYETGICSHQFSVGKCTHHKAAPLSPLNPSSHFCLKESFKNIIMRFLMLVLRFCNKACLLSFSHLLSVLTMIEEHLIAQAYPFYQKKNPYFLST